MDTKAKIMTTEEMQDYFQKIGRAELYEEIEAIKNRKDGPKRKTISIYLKAIRTSLIALGYNSLWVNTTFKYAMLRYFFKDELEDTNKN